MNIRFKPVVAFIATLTTCNAYASLVTNPNDSRSWQEASVGTFAQLFYGANTAMTRQQVIDHQLLDDGYFDPRGYLAGSLIRLNGINIAGNSSWGNGGVSLDAPNQTQPGVDSSYAYTFDSNISYAQAANAVDNLWVQTDNVVGNTVFDLGFQATKAAVFNTLDHGPLPLEAIESTVYLSNDMIHWQQAVTERIWLEGIYGDTSVLWDGFAYAVGTANGSTFRYASIIWGGPGALQADGDNEINGIMGLQSNYTPISDIPEPATSYLLGLGMLFGMVGRKQYSLCSSRRR